MEGTVDVNLDNQGSMTKVHDRVHGSVHCEVAEQEVGVVNAIIDDSSWRGGGVREVPNEVPLA